MEWTTDWEGTSEIRLKGINQDGGDGIFSNALKVVCSICAGINKNDNLPGIQIYPKPSAGKFVVMFDKNIRIKEIIVLNTSKEVLFKHESKTLDSLQINIKLSDCSHGIYYVLIKTANSWQIRKIVVL